MRQRTGPGVRRTAARSSHMPDRGATPDRWSASWARVSSSDRMGAVWMHGHFWPATVSLPRGWGQLPLVFEQILEKQVAPLGWRLRPSDFRTTGNGIGSDSCAELALPHEPLIFQGAAFRL